MYEGHFCWCDRAVFEASSHSQAEICLGENTRAALPPVKEAVFWENSKPGVLSTGPDRLARKILALIKMVENPNVYFALRDNKFTCKGIHVDTCPSLHRDDFAGLPGECLICSTRTAKLLYACTQQTWSVSLSRTPPWQAWKPLPQSCMRPTNTGHTLPLQELL